MEDFLSLFVTLRISKKILSNAFIANKAHAYFPAEDVHSLDFVKKVPPPNVKERKKKKQNAEKKPC